MGDVKLALTQTRYALRGFLRQRSTISFTVAMPVVLLVLFNMIFHGKTTEFYGQPVPVGSYYTAAMVAYEVMIMGFGSMLISVTTDRERGLLKRFRGTPMPSSVYLVAEIGQTIVVVAASVVVLVGVGAIFYHVKMSGDLLIGLVVYVVLGTASFCALSLAMTRICSTTDSASAIGPFSTVILAFISGVFIPASQIPTWLLDIAQVFPLEHLARGLQTAFLTPGSTGITAANLAVIAAWGLGGLLVAVRTFRWEPLAVGA